MSDPNFWVGPSTNVPVVNADGNIFEETQVAAAAQTVFTLLTFTYTPNTHSIFVFKNGTMLRRGVEYTETSSTQVTLATGAALNDKLSFVAYAIQQIIPPIVYNGMPAGGTAGQQLVKSSGNDYDAAWSNPTNSTALIDAARVNIAAASTVNLSAVAATTRNVQVTGTTQIDGFQVSNGQVWVLRFSGTLILKNNANIVTQSGYDIRVSPGDTCLVRATADNVMEVISYSRADSSLQHNWNDFRLTLSTGVPVPTADVIGATTIYCTPYKGNKITLWNGTAWVVRESAEFSLAIAGLTVSRPYDVFCYDNAGTPTLEFLSWTSDTVRTTALTTQNGVLVKTGDATRKYLGTFYTTAANSTEDSSRQRLVWNFYNRVKRSLFRTEPAVSWTYNSAVIRQANANILNQLNVVCGVAEDAIEVSVDQLVSHTVANTQLNNFIGLNSTITGAAAAVSIPGLTSNAGSYAKAASKYCSYGSLGYNSYTWLENVPLGGATGTFYGSSACIAGSCTA